jgi:Kef-type K+ transport system membrane component KefB
VVGETEFTNLLIVVAAGFAAPLALGLVPRLRLPSAVVELLLGIALGPAMLGWVEIDEPVRVISVLGLAVLLFLAGLEIEFERLRGSALRVAVTSYVVSFAVALVAGLALDAAGLVRSPVFVAVLLSATSLGVLIPVLKDADRIQSTFGQLVIAAASIADFAAVILLSLFFSTEAKGTATQAVLLGSLVIVALVVGLAVAGLEHSTRVRDTLLRLQDTTAQIRVRGAFVLLVGFAALATELGLEIILGAFLAGALLTLVDRDEAMTHPQFRRKLEAVGFGVFIPVFFVSSGVAYDLDALTESASTLVRVPVFLLALVLARGLPALLYRRLISTREMVVAGLMQATSLPFIVAGTAIGKELGVVSDASAAALVAAGLISVLVFPAASLGLLKR